MKKNPKPKNSREFPEITLMAQSFLEQRRKQGIATYGKGLKPFNGRDSLLDAVEEAADMFLYLMQAYIELGVGKKSFKRILKNVQSQKNL